jgi:glucoamylase
LRIHADTAFRIHFSTDDWATATDIDSTSTNLGIDYCDIPIPGDQRVPLRFTFFWIVANLWEVGNFEVACTERDPGITK